MKVACENARGQKGAREAYRRSRRDHSDPFFEDQTEHIDLASAERDPYRYLRSPLADRIRDDSVYSRCGKHKGDG